jgi:hypothetical protein
MKKIKLICLFFSLLLAGVFTSCLDDLNTTPLEGGSVLTPDAAWQDINTYNQFTAKIYACFALSGNIGPNGLDDITGNDQGEATFLRSYWNLQELTTDEAVCAWSDNGLSGLMFCNWTSSNRFCELSYNRILMTIAYCNEFLRNTDDKVLSERGVKEDLKAQIHTYRNEVKAIRAMKYYFLMDLYANVPYVPEDAPVGAYFPEQKGRDFFFPWIESELKALEGQLPAKSTANYGKINDPVIWTVLAKMYLNADVYTGEKKYTEAITYLKKVIEAGYILDPVYKNLFGADNDLSPEMIFPVIFDGKRATSYGGTTYLMAGAYGSDMNPATTFGLNQSWAGLRAKETLSALFTSTDKRALFWTQKRTIETNSLYDFMSGYSVIKYTNLKSDGAPGSDPAFPDTDFPFFRLADVYLMYAEAVLRGGNGGNKTEALNYVNDIRDRADVSRIGDSQLTLDFILDERARELYWEGHRRTDLIRFDKYTANYKWPWKNGVYLGTATISDIYKIFPIPATELSANSNIKQNKGY